MAATKEKKRKEIYTYEAPWDIFGVACSQRKGDSYEARFAVGSFIEEYSNKVQIVQLDDESEQFVLRGTIDHPYPTTKIQWAPEEASRERDLFATAGDYLRIWVVRGDGDIRHEGIFNNHKSSEYCAPVTSFEWNPLEASTIATCSIDTTVTVWDVATRRVKAQLIAHDKEVYDLAWSSRSSSVFATVSDDGSLRMFDLRTLDHSTILYEHPGAKSLLRLSWNPLDPNFMATIAADSSRAIVLDLRMPMTPVAELGGHTAPVNGAIWAPHSASHIVTVGDDSQALIWDLSQLPKPVDDPILAYVAEGPINQAAWSASMCEWVTIAFGNRLQILRV